MEKQKSKYAVGKHPNSLAALKKGGGWKPGQSGNPKGRPPGIKYVSEALRELLEAEPNLARRLAKSLAKRALKSDAALSLVFERMEGKITQPIGGAGGGPVVLKVIYDSSDGIQDTSEES